jgi:hypothetical protein
VAVPAAAAGSLVVGTDPAAAVAYWSPQWMLPHLERLEFVGIPRVSRKQKHSKAPHTVHKLQQSNARSLPFIGSDIAGLHPSLMPVLRELVLTVTPDSSLGSLLALLKSATGEQGQILKLHLRFEVRCP